MLGWGAHLRGWSWNPESFIKSSTTSTQEPVLKALCKKENYIFVIVCGRCEKSIKGFIPLENTASIQTEVKHITLVQKLYNSANSL